MVKTNDPENPPPLRNGQLIYICNDDEEISRQLIPTGGTMVIAIAAVGVTALAVSAARSMLSNNDYQVMKTITSVVNPSNLLHSLTTSFSNFMKNVLPSPKHEQTPNFPSLLQTASRTDQMMEVQHHTKQIEQQFEELLMQNDELRVSLQTLQGSLEKYKTNEKYLSEISETLQRRESELTVKDYDLSFVRAENRELKGKYKVVLEEVEEVKWGLSRSVVSLEKENARLNKEILWLMHSGVPLMIWRLIWSEEFEKKISKVVLLNMELGRQMGLQEARDHMLSPSTPDELLPGYDRRIKQKANEALMEFKRDDWECVNELIGNPELSPAFLRRALCQEVLDNH